MSPAVHVALLRGINVGGKQKVPMPELAALFAEAGCRDVRTYIQSGNVVFRTCEPGGLAGHLAARIAQRFGFAVPVVLRSHAELVAITAGNPFLAAGADPDTLHVVFLADRPDPGRVAGLDPGRSPPDALIAGDREIFLRCPEGFARTKFTNSYFDRQLTTTSTVRNWRTVLKLVELAQT